MYPFIASTSNKALESPICRVLRMSLAYTLVCLPSSPVGMSVSFFTIAADVRKLTSSFSATEYFHGEGGCYAAGEGVRSGGARAEGRAEGLGRYVLEASAGPCARNEHRPVPPAQRQATAPTEFRYHLSPHRLAVLQPAPTKPQRRAGAFRAAVRGKTRRRRLSVMRSAPGVSQTTATPLNR